MKNVGDGRRVAKAEKEVQHLVAQFLINGFKRSLPGLVTVTRVSMPGDLRSARVFVSIFAEKSDQKKAVDILQRNAGEVQGYIGKNLPMRYCPVLKFILDEGTEHMSKMDRLLKELEEDRKLKASNLEAQDSDDKKSESEVDSDDSNKE